jgi:hypothetical protein
MAASQFPQGRRNGQPRGGKTVNHFNVRQNIFNSPSNRKSVMIAWREANHST